MNPNDSSDFNKTETYNSQKVISNSQNTKREFTGHRICLCREREGCMKHYQSAVLSLDITEACCMVCATCRRNGNIRDLFHKGFETMFTSKTTDRQKNH